MSAMRGEVNGPDVVSEIRSLASPLTGVGDLNSLVDRVGPARFVFIGEASYGTHEY